MYSTHYSCQISIKLGILDIFSTNTPTPNFKKILPVGNEMFHVERRTDRLLIFAFRNFANAPKNHSNYIKYEYTNPSLLD
jgi:hypothetical protein